MSALPLEVITLTELLKNEIPDTVIPMDVTVILRKLRQRLSEVEKSIVIMERLAGVRRHKRIEIGIDRPSARSARRRRGKR